MRSTCIFIAAMTAWALTGCNGTEDAGKSPVRLPDPLDSLLGHYSGTVEKTVCQEPDIPTAGSCGRMQTDTLPASSVSLSRGPDSSLALYLPGLAAVTVIPGDTIRADSADTVGAVTCFRIPDQRIAPSGALHPETDYEQVGGGEICLDAAGYLTPFTLRAKNDPQLLAGDRHLYRGLHRVPPPPPD